MVVNAAVEDTWANRVMAQIGPKGYDKCMRRSLQTVIFYEASTYCSIVVLFRLRSL